MIGVSSPSEPFIDNGRLFRLGGVVGLLIAREGNADQVRAGNTDVTVRRLYLKDAAVNPDNGSGKFGPIFQLNFFRCQQRRGDEEHKQTATTDNIGHEKPSPMRR